MRELQGARDALIEFNARIREAHIQAGREHVKPASGDAQPAQLTPAELAELEALGYTDSNAE